MTTPTKRTNGRKSRDRRDSGYVKCFAEPGMFRDELLVFIDGIDPKHPSRVLNVQVLVDSDLVRCESGEPERGKPVAGFLAVGVARKSRGIATIVLPQPGIPVGQTMLVKEDSLVEK